MELYDTTAEYVRSRGYFLTGPQTDDPLPLGDLERRAGTYVLGRSGTGKTTLLVNLMEHDIRQGHGLFFLDPHGDGIRDLLARADWGARLDDLWLFDPTDETHSFSINVFDCKDIHNTTERARAFNCARTVLNRLFEKDAESQPWLN